MYIKRILTWKLLFALTLLSIFISMTVFVYQEQMKLPSENWSLGVPIDTYEINTDFDSKLNQNTIALSTPDGSILNIYAQGTSLILKRYRITGEFLAESKVNLGTTALKVEGQIKQNQAHLSAYTPDNKTLHFMTIDPETLKVHAQKSQTIDGTGVTLNKGWAVSYAPEYAQILTDQGDITVPFESEGNVAIANAMRVNDHWILTSLNQMNSRYHLYLTEVSPSGNVLSKEKVTSMVSRSTIMPLNIAMSDLGGSQTIVTTMKDRRFGTNYVNYINRSDFGTYDIESFEVETYMAIPYFVRNGDQVRFLMNFWNQGLGRTELARGFNSYQNLFMIDPNDNTTKQLTISQSPSIKPSFFTIEEYDYLVHNEIDDTEGTVFLSSNNPEIIDLSRQLTPTIAADVFLRTLVVYPSIVMSSFVVIIISLSAVFAFLIPVMMFGMNWAERNKKIVTLLTILMFLGSLTITFDRFFLQKMLRADRLPDFMSTPTLSWAFFAFFTAVALICFWDRQRRIKHRKEYFLKNTFVFIGIELLFITMFFLPYQLI